MGLDIVEMIMEVEEKFGIDIPDTDAAELRTIGSLYAYVRDHAPDLPRLTTPAAANLAPTADPVWQRVVDIVERATGQRGDRLPPNTRFIEDLGMG
jgi:hypothetical protein